MADYKRQRPLQGQQNNVLPDPLPAPLPPETDGTFLCGFACPTYLYLLGPAIHGLDGPGSDATAPNSSLSAGNVPLLFSSPGVRLWTQIISTPCSLIDTLLRWWAELGLFILSMMVHVPPVGLPETGVDPIWDGGLRLRVLLMAGVHPVLGLLLFLIAGWLDPTCYDRLYSLTFSVALNYVLMFCFCFLFLFCLEFSWASYLLLLHSNHDHCSSFGPNTYLGLHGVY